MKFNLELGSEGTYLIRSYQAGEISVAAALAQPETLTHSVVITPQRLLRDWPPQRFDELRADHFAMLADLRPEVVLLGCGNRLRFPHPSLTAPLTALGIAVEAMDTGAACRTYNILIAEGRQVAAALLMI
ncbi:MAG: Mth938-like domain-containing protein [Pseudomonadota bacterium]